MTEDPNFVAPPHAEPVSPGGPPEPNEGPPQLQGPPPQGPPPQGPPGPPQGPSGPPQDLGPPEPKRPLTVRHIVLAGVVVALLLAAVAFVLRPRSPARARSIGARLDLAAGEVSLSEGGTVTKGMSGTPLAIGAHVTTQKGSRALVRTGDGAAVFLRGETEIVLGERGIEVDHGEVWLDAPHLDGEAIECRLGKHVVSASDSGLSITRSGDDVNVYVARGLSILTSPGGRVEINAGEQGTAKGSEKPTLAPMAFWQDWTGGMGDQRSARGAGSSGSGHLYGMDPSAPPGSPAKKLGIAKQIVRAVLRDGVAETEVDQTFSNPGGSAIEGYYWFTVPLSATVTSFALETNGVLVEGEVVEKREAAARYAAAVRAANDPALLEWVDGRTYRARIFPIPASGNRRVVLRYVEMLPTVEGKTRYVYPLRSDDPVRFDELSLSVDLGAKGSDFETSTSLDARLENGGRLVTMRRSGYVPRADFQLEMAAKASAKRNAVRAWRFQAGADQADYVMLRYVPETDFAKLPPAKGELVLVVDTSAGGDESARALRTATAEAILRALSDQDRFALVALDVVPTVVYPKEGLASATEADIAKALERLSDHAVGGATDIGAMFEPALERLHGTEQPAVVYVGDGAPTSGETTASGLADRLRRSLTGSRARLFGVGVGSDARHELLSLLTREGGGQYFRVDEADQTTGQALRLASAIKAQTITDVDVDLGAGLDQPFYSTTGKLSRGEELVLLARTHHPLPEKVRIRGRVNGADFKDEYPLKVESSVTTALVPRLWAAEYVRRLLGSSAGTDDGRSQILSLGIEYGLVTPYSSILALDSESAYANQGIPRRSSRLRGVRLTSIVGDAHEQELVDRFGPSVPATLMGCDRRSPSADRGGEEVEDKSGSVGTRAKGEEGSMGAARAPAAQATAVPGSPPPPPEAADALDGKGDAKNETIPGVALVAPTTTTQEVSTPTAAAGMAHPRPAQVHAVVPEPKTEGKKTVLKAAPIVPPTPARVYVARRALTRCSDAASRPLAERIVVWQKRLKRLTNPIEIVQQYESARAGCELRDWRDQAALLELVQQTIGTEGSAEIVLTHFASEPEAQRFVARGILRRTVDLRVAAVVSRVLFHGVDWVRVDRDLADLDKPEKKLLYLRSAMLVAPGDPQGDVRLVKLLSRTGQRQEALSYGRRLRDRGFLTPSLAQQLGDVLYEANEKDEALRTYSEIVEFDGQSPASRRVLGDILLRQGWYPAAYRQYKTLTDLDGKSPVHWLRLATAAAGAGRVDEALRIEREVASGEGTPGPADPRYFARLWSASRLGVLFATPSLAQGTTPDAIARKLKELQLFSGPGVLALLTWEDLDARLQLVAADDKKETLAGEVTDAGVTGLSGLLTSSAAWEKTTRAVRWKSEPLGRAVKFQLVTLTWDGKAFKVLVKNGTLGADARQEGL